MQLRQFLPKHDYYTGPLRLFSRTRRASFLARITYVGKHGCTEPTEILMGTSLIVTGLAMFQTGSEFLSPSWAWAIANIFAGLLMFGGMLTRDNAGRMWSGFFCFQLRIWICSKAFLANPPDLQWVSAAVGSLVGFWLFMRYFCVILHSPPLEFKGSEKRHKRRRIQDYSIDIVKDLCVPKG